MRNPDWARFERARFPRLISDADAHSFLRGLDATPPLFRIEDGYKLFSDFLPRLISGRDRQWNLMEGKKAYVHIRDETIVQYGVASDLVLDYGWPRSSVVCEPGTDGTLSGGPVDIILTVDGRTRLAVEAKASPRMLDSLVAGINACRGSTTKGHSVSDHKKCLGLRYFGSTHFWLVAADSTRRLYEVTKAGPDVVLTLTASTNPLLP